MFNEIPSFHKKSKPPAKPTEFGIPRKFDNLMILLSLIFFTDKDNIRMMKVVEVKEVISSVFT